MQGFTTMVENWHKK